MNLVEMVLSIFEIGLPYRIGHGVLLRTALHIDKCNALVERKSPFRRIADLKHQPIMTPRPQGLEMGNQLVEGVEQVRHKNDHASRR